MQMTVYQFFLSKTFCERVIQKSMSLYADENVGPTESGGNKLRTYRLLNKKLL